MICRFIVGTAILSMVPCLGGFMGLSPTIFFLVPHVGRFVGFHSDWFVEDESALRLGVLVHNGGGLLILPCLPHTLSSFRCCQGFFEHSRCWCFVCRRWHVSFSYQLWFGFVWSLITSGLFFALTILLLRHNHWSP